MQKVQIDSKFISLNDIQRCIEAFEKILSGQDNEKNIEITASVRIEGVDPLLISYFILFKKQIPKIQITLSLPLNPNEPDNDKLEYQLKQFGTYAYLMTGEEVFQLELGTGVNKLRISFDLKNQTTFHERWFVFSNDYFPMLLITDNNDFFDFIFNNSLNTLSNVNDIFSERLITWEKNSESIKKNYHIFLRQNSRPKDRKGSLINLANMAFVNSLNEAKIAHLYFEKEYNKFTFNSKDKIQAGSLVNEKAFDYLNRIKPIFEELHNSTLCHQFFFSTILATEMLKDKESGKDVLNDSTKDSFIKKIINLWEFTKDLVAGVNELAKNIREHSSPPIGVISVRLFGIKKWIQTKVLFEDENNIYQEYKQYLLNNNFTDESSVIEINVTDLGKLGVIPTLIKNTELVFSSFSENKIDIKKLITEDIENLKSKQIGFHNLLNTSKQQLNQQSKRSIAHFGLLTLSKLIEHNKGLIAASTQSDNSPNNRESICIPDLIKNYFHPIKSGTNYSIVLPINPLITYSTHLPHKFKLPSETTAKDIRGVEELFQYEFLNLIELKKTNFSMNSSVKYIIELDFKEISLTNRDEEDVFWNNIVSDISVLKKHDGIKYALCINLKNVSINESQLFRLLGSIELNIPNIPIIILNIKNDCYQRLIKINSEFHKQNKKLAYWNENIATLVYSYLNIRDVKFYFSDILWGNIREDFIKVNWLISFYSFNSTTMLFKESMKEKVTDYKVDVNPNTEFFFSNTKNLLPFELIIKSSTNTTLFEENTLVLLKNELKA